MISVDIGSPHQPWSFTQPIRWAATFVILDQDNALTAL
jgi:hypothetical protein